MQPKPHKNTSIFIALIITLISVTPTTKLNAGQLELGMSFPPVTQAAHRAFTEQQLKALNIRKIRFAENWALREPKAGSYQWGPLDQRLQWAQEQGIDVMLTIQSIGPKWACDPQQRNQKSCVFKRPEAFKTYISTLLQRYPGQIHSIQLGNEWQSTFGFIGTAQEFVSYTNTVYKAVQRYSPTTHIILGGISSEALNLVAYCAEVVPRYYESHLDRYYLPAQRDNYCQLEAVKKGMHKLDHVIAQARYDVLDLHLYDDAENWPLYVQAFTERLPQHRRKLPIIVSEFGGPNLSREPDYSDDYQAQRLSVYLQVLEQLEIGSAYYFQLVQSEDAHPSHLESGLFRMVDGVPVKKPAYEVLRE